MAILPRFRIFIQLEGGEIFEGVPQSQFIGCNGCAFSTLPNNCSLLCTAVRE